MLPELCFEYHPVERVCDLDDLFQMCDEAREMLEDRYVLLTSVNEKDVTVPLATCHIHEMLLLDIAKVNNTDIRKAYDNVYKGYPLDVISTIIVDDADNIKRKIQDIICLASSQWNTDTLQLHWKRYYANATEVSSVPNILYELCQTNYRLIDQHMDQQNVTVTIVIDKSKDPINRMKENEEYD